MTKNSHNDAAYLIEGMLVDLLIRCESLTEREREMEAFQLMISLLEEDTYNEIERKNKKLVTSYLIAIMMILRNGELLCDKIGKEGYVPEIVDIIGFDLFISSCERKPAPFGAG